MPTSEEKDWCHIEQWLEECRKGLRSETYRSTHDATGVPEK